MQLTNHWYYSTSAIDKKDCNKLKRIEKKHFESALVDRHHEITKKERVTGINSDFGLNKKKRVSDVCWTTQQWVYDLIWPYMISANEQGGWNFEVDAAESVQITRYKISGFYTWHSDGGSDCLSVYDTPDNSFLNGKVRKLSMSILLNDNYEGGELQIATTQKGKSEIQTPEFNKAGSVIVFPSFLEHRVLPVTKGTRFSLVAWFLGPPFK